jgi:hypothetical protein
MKHLLPAVTSIFGLLLMPAIAQPDSPESIIYDHSGNEVGVIQRQTPSGGFIVLPTQGTLGLGYYDIMIPADMMRRRPSGGWETTLTHEQLASFRPTDDRFWQSSGF